MKVINLIKILNNNKYLLTSALLFISNLSYISAINAKTFTIPKSGNVVGSIKTIPTSELDHNDNFLTLSKKYNVGFHELKEANPDVSPWKLGYGEVIIPDKYILPKIRDGIVINLAELRLYYFPKNSNKVITYPVGIGKKGWQTPTTKTSVIDRIKNPTWTVPRSIIDEVDARGGAIPGAVERGGRLVVPAGDDNPLGKYALRLGENGYLIHGTNSNVGVGLRVSHGCIRLFNEDIKDLYNRVPKGTPVHIINEPYKFGNDGKIVYLEAHQPLSEDDSEFSYEDSLSRYRLNHSSINEDATIRTATELRGIPVPIGNI